MGGRGANSSAASGSAGSVTLNQKNADYFNNIVQQQMERLTESFGNAKNDAEKTYYQNELETYTKRFANAMNISENSLKNMLIGKSKVNVIQESTPSRKSSPTLQTSKTFVNSDGEATSRVITSLSYNRAQKRLQKQINSMFNW